ncbi:MAG TPA: DNA cytosine methyltransferase [Ktedonobacteraceae bacterium]|nr:DNA cytosine methyltransferase [Ktedonobacteraceae bacterium]
MREIEQIPWNGRNVVSTFSGCGGSCLGFRLAGYRILWANEFIPAARDTYKANHPHSILDARDIRKIKPDEILKAIHLNQGELDVFEGSPPCASFSTAGKREASWGKVKDYSDTRQRVDDLFFEYVRLLKGLQPKVFVAENVSGLVKGTAKGYFLEILKELKSCGYTVEAKILDAQWLGVPQMRQRLIFVGVRNDLVEQYKIRPAHPAPLPYTYTVREALPWIIRQGAGPVFGTEGWRDTSTSPSGTIGASPAFGNGLSPSSLIEAIPVRAIHDAKGQPQYSKGDITDTPSPTLTTMQQWYIEEQHVPIRAIRDDRGAFGNGSDITDQPSPTVLSGSVGTHWIEEQIVEPESDISKFAIGREWDKLKPGEQSQKYFSLQRAPLDGPCPTVTQTAGTAWSPAAAAGVTHPTEKRKFSIAELKRICAFPDDFILTGTYSQQWERLGRAVPPVMMEKVAKTIQERILDQCEQ